MTKLAIACIIPITVLNLAVVAAPVRSGVVQKAPAPPAIDHMKILGLGSHFSLDPKMVVNPRFDADKGIIDGRPNLRARR